MLPVTLVTQETGGRQKTQKTKKDEQHEPHQKNTLKTNLIYINYLYIKYVDQVPVSVDCPFLIALHFSLTHVFILSLV
jgi:hypothetical protein